VLVSDKLVGEARERRVTRMSSREKAVLGASAALFLAVATAIAEFLPSGRDLDIVLVVLLVAAYAVVGRMPLEFGNGYVVPEQLILVPLLLLAPLNLVPLLVVAGALLAMAPELFSGRWHQERWAAVAADSWFSVGPVLVIAALAPGEPAYSDAPVYALAFGAQLGADFAWALLRDRVIDRVPVWETVRAALNVTAFDAILAPLAFSIGILATDAPVRLLALAPLLLLLTMLSTERRERYGTTLELHRAYRGTVMLLADVVESDDKYTADHSRSVVELAESVADELGLPASERQELEFAALLHDVGKIAIPNELLNKPASLTDEEFELMKRHTLEGEQMLDRVGGLMQRVGKVVRSCHERWDGTGYPDGLAGDAIPLAARIVFACDAYNAMTTDRPYRQALPREVALEELRAESGSQFDPRVVNALVGVLQRGTPPVGKTDEVRLVVAGSLVPQRAGTAT
jgi:putative nucleotidyltransferase with HDIG domain